MDDSCHVITTSTLRKYLVTKNKVRSTLCFILKQLGLTNVELSVSFIGQKRMRDLNLSYRGKNKSTDVLSFPASEWSRPLKLKKSNTPINSQKHPMPLGDLVISIADAAKTAKSIGHAIDRETCFLMVHGILHLCGHDHIQLQERKLMFQQQKLIMELLLPLRTQLWHHLVTAR